MRVQSARTREHREVVEPVSLQPLWMRDFGAVHHRKRRVVVAWERARWMGGDRDALLCVDCRDGICDRTLWSNGVRDADGDEVIVRMRDLFAQ